jgi:DNA end-binding protein Ku
MHSIWSGSISFGLVNIPVKLASAVQSDEIKFHSLSKGDGAQIRYKKINEATGKEVAFKDIVKGYEYEKGKFVIIEDSDFDKVSRVKSDTIDITQFCKAEEIDPLLYDKPYFIQPGKGGEKTYKLLEQALSKTGLVGVSEFMLRNREHVCVVRPYKGHLILEQLRYVDELRSIEEIAAPAVTIGDKELQLAQQLIKQLTTKFNAGDFKDNYVEEVKKIIKAKTAGKKLRAVTRETTAAPSKVTDLMAVLKASLDGGGKKKKAA